MKKGDVDIAIFIGAIVIPVAALVGGLILTFAVIEGLTQGIVIVTTIAHDTSSLSSVAYSVPEDINIYYRPPFDCRIIDNKLKCLSDEMEIKNLILSPNYISARTFRHVKDDFKSSASLKFTVTTPDQMLPIEFHTYSSLKEKGAVHIGYERGRIKISKTNTGLYNTLGISQNQEDPLYQIVSDVLYSCKDGTQRGGLIILPPSYYFCVEGNVLHLKKYIHLPHEVTPPYYLPDDITEDQGELPHAVALINFGDVITIHSFDFDKLECDQRSFGNIMPYGNCFDDISNCEDLEDEDVFVVGGCNGNPYSKYDIVRHGMKIDYLSYISGSTVHLDLERKS